MATILTTILAASFGLAIRKAVSSLILILLYMMAQLTTTPMTYHIFAPSFQSVKFHVDYMLWGGGGVSWQ